jgi:hypothetical protein
LLTTGSFSGSGQRSEWLIGQHHNNKFEPVHIMTFTKIRKYKNSIQKYRKCHY